MPRCQVPKEEQVHICRVHRLLQWLPTPQSYAYAYDLRRQRQSRAFGCRGNRSPWTPWLSGKASWKEKRADLARDKVFLTSTTSLPEYRTSQVMALEDESENEREACLHGFIRLQNRHRKIQSSCTTGAIRFANCASPSARQDLEGSFGKHAILEHHFGIAGVARILVRGLLE